MIFLYLLLGGSMSSPLPHDATNGTDVEQHFFSRVSSIPLVNTSINKLSSIYEGTKATSRVVKVTMTYYTLYRLVTPCRPFTHSKFHQ